MTALDTAIKNTKKRLINTDKIKMQTQPKKGYIKMKIYEAKASNYNSVTPENIARYIREYAGRISEAANNDRLKNANKTQLKAIAAELETVCKRLDYILEGKY